MSVIEAEIQQPDSPTSRVLEAWRTQHHQLSIDWLAVFATDWQRERIAEEDEAASATPPAPDLWTAPALSMFEAAIGPRLTTLNPLGLDGLLQDLGPTILSLPGRDALGSASPRAWLERFIDDELEPVCRSAGPVGVEVLRLLADPQTRYSAQRLAIVINFLAAHRAEWRSLPPNALLTLAITFVVVSADRTQ